MRPLSDHTPKPLLEVGGKALIVRQVEALRAAGVHHVVINVSYRADQLMDALGDGSRFGVEIDWSVEPEPLETAGGIATAYPLLRSPFIIVASADIVTDFDYASLVLRAQRVATRAEVSLAHLVMVPNPPYHPRGDFALCENVIREGEERLTFGNIALYDTSLFAELPRGTKLKLLPCFRAWIADGIVTGELHPGKWFNVGTPDDLLLAERALQTP